MKLSPLSRDLFSPNARGVSPLGHFGASHCFALTQLSHFVRRRPMQTIDFTEARSEELLASRLQLIEVQDDLSWLGSCKSCFIVVEVFCRLDCGAYKSVNSLQYQNERIVRMSAIVRWNPLREMEDIQRRMTSLFDGGMLRRSNLTNDQENITVPEWAPLVDIAEDEKEYLIKVELPEVQKEDVKVTLENGTLTISGERKAEKEEKSRKFHRVERYYGRFERSFTVPDGANTENVKAEFKDGVLRVHLAKSEKSRPKQIEVKVG
jgi:HSP20 family protein